jgi:hypothetical protein
LRSFSDVIPSKAKILKLEAILLKKEFALPAESSEQQQQLMLRESSTRSNSSSSFSIGFVSLLPYICKRTSGKYHLRKHQRMMMGV